MALIGRFLLLVVVGWQVFERQGYAAPPRVTDERYKLELVAKEPEIVTPVGMTFDSKGRVEARVFNIAAGSPLLGKPGLTTGNSVSGLAVMLYDRALYEAKGGDVEKKQYLNESGTLRLVNRYNGTLIATE